MELPTELPPLNSSIHMAKSKNIHIQNKYNEIKNLRNDIGSKLNYLNSKNMQTIRLKKSNISTTIGSIKPEIIRLQQQDSLFSEDVKITKSIIEKINTDIFQLHANADLYQVRIDLGVFQKANQKLRDFNSDISNLSKKIDANEAKYSKKESKIKEKLEEMKALLELKESELLNLDVAKMRKRIDKISAFVQNSQLTLMLKYMQIKNTQPVIPVQVNTNTNFNISSNLDNWYEICQSRIDNKIKSFRSQIEINAKKINNSQNELSDLNRKSSSLDIKKIEEESENMEVKIEERLSSAENKLNLLIKSLENSPLHIKIETKDNGLPRSFEDVYMEDIKKYAKDWELFHKNNCKVQEQVYGIIDKFAPLFVLNYNFDNQVSEKGSFLKRLDNAEKLADYCCQRVLKWKEEEEKKKNLSLTDNYLVEKMIELEEKVQIAESRIKQIDGKEFDEMPSIRAEGLFRFPIPPPPLAPKQDLEPYYLENDSILTYEQEIYNGDNGVVFNIDLPKSSFIDIPVEAPEIVIKREAPNLTVIHKDNNNEDNNNDNHNSDDDGSGDNNSDDDNNNNDDNDNSEEDNSEEDDSEEDDSEEDKKEDEKKNEKDKEDDKKDKEDDKKEEEEKKEISNYDERSSYSSSSISPSLYSMFRIKKRKKRSDNRCYNPFTPIKKGDNLRF